MHCHAGCSQEQVIEALRGRGLWRSNGTGRRCTPPPLDWTKPKPGTSGTVVRAWEHSTASGARFTVRRTDAPGKPKDIKRIPAGVEGPYLPLIRKPADDYEGPLVVTEGEIAADAVLEADYAAACWPGGAKAITSTKWDGLGGDVVLWPDHDGEGRKCMEWLARVLADNPNVSVRIVDVSGLPPKGDAVDVSLEDRGAMIEDAAPPPPVLLTWAEYKALADEEPEGTFVVPKLYRRGQSSLLVGEPKAGKSTLCRRIAVGVAKGGRVLGQDVTAAPVVYMALQEDPRHVVREVEAVNPDDPDPGVHFYTHNPERDAEWDALAAAVKRIEAVLVIVDMVADFRAWEDGNDYVEMKGIIGRFTKLARNCDCHVLLVHHGNKTPATSYPTARVHGSQAIAGEVDVVASVHRDVKKGKRIFQAEGRGIGFYERPIGELT